MLFCILRQKTETHLFCHWPVGAKAKNCARVRIDFRRREWGGWNPEISAHLETFVRCYSSTRVDFSGVLQSSASPVLFCFFFTPAFLMNSYLMRPNPYFKEEGGNRRGAVGGHLSRCPPLGESKELTERWVCPFSCCEWRDHLSYPSTLPCCQSRRAELDADDRRCHSDRTEKKKKKKKKIFSPIFFFLLTEIIHPSFCRLFSLSPPSAATHPARLPSAQRWSLVSLSPGLGGAVQRATRSRESVPPSGGGSSRIRPRRNI